MSKEVSRLSKKQTVFDRILSFVEGDGAVILSSDEELILQRWTFAYKVWLQRKHKESEIIQKIIDMFHVSGHTARNDIYTSQALFAGSIRSNKKFLLHHHAENILLYIEKCKLDKSLSHLVPKLMDSYTKCVKDMPTDENKKVMPPPVMNFFLTSDQNIPLQKSIEDAIVSMKQRQSVEDIPYEEMNTDEPVE